ncbi:MAG: hypothetical protein DMG77_18620 [Acidobacteria bacterium]|nr:MAG: hypothetical protein DMG77_18620 [Acidobacteriota bacterium]
MGLSGRLVHFWFSPSGREALKEAISGGSDFEALVVEENELGLWIWMPDAEQDSREVTLLKLEYFAAASLEYEPPEAPRERPGVGFQAS